MEFNLITGRPASKEVQSNSQSNSNPSSGNRMESNPSNKPILIVPAIQDLIEGLKLPEKPAELETKSASKANLSNKWEPSKLNGRHRVMMRMILEGGTYDEIAATLGMSSQAVMLVANSAIFKEELLKLEAQADWQVIRRAEELSNEALSVLRDKMRRARSEALQASCAEKILGIAGYSKIEKKQVAIVSGEDVIRELNRRRRERAFGSGGSAESKYSQSDSPSGDSSGSVAISFEASAS